jgi:V/A-type H+-transporting ATPase subunit K
MKSRVVLASFLVFIVGVFATVGSLLLWFPPAMADETVNIMIDPEVLGWGYLAAALATGLSSLGAGFAVASVGTAAIGALTEKPEMFGRVIILVGLAEGIAIYGLIISVLVLNELG